MATTMGGDMLLPRHYLEGFHPDYTDCGKLEARAKEEGFESWTTYFGQTRQSWATIVPRYNPELPTILPFYLTEYSTDISQWKRNPYYWKVDPAGNQLPYMERIVVTNVEDLEVWNGKTLAGEYTMSGFLTSVEDFALFKESEEAGDYRVINWPTPFAAAVNYEPNLTAPDMDLRPIFQDVRFRRALSRAINRDEINQVVFFGLGEPAQMTLLPTSKLLRGELRAGLGTVRPRRRQRVAGRVGAGVGRTQRYRLLPNGKRFSFTVEYISIPQIPLWMALSAALPANWPPLRVYFGITLILSIVGWTGLARVVRGKLLELRESDFVMAARIAGALDGAIIRRHLLPSFMSYLIVSLTLAVPGMILGETALSFLGLGLRPPVVSWGVLLQKAQNLRTVALHSCLLIPAGFVVVTVLAFNFLGDGLRDAADPYK